MWNLFLKGKLFTVVFYRDTLRVPSYGQAKVLFKILDLEALHETT